MLSSESTMLQGLVAMAAGYTGGIPTSPLANTEIQANSHDSEYTSLQKLVQLFSGVGGGVCLQNTNTDLSPYILKSATFTAMPMLPYAIDTTLGSFNIIIDSSLSVGKYIDFADAFGTWNTHPPTFLRNDFKIEGAEIDFTDSAQGAFLRILNVGGDTGLRILESGAKPHNIGLPVITGNTVGMAITTTNGLWTGNPTSFTYQWQISDDGLTVWTNISGATSSTYTVVTGDVGKYIKCVVTATNSSGTCAGVSSNNINAVAAASLFPTSGLAAYWKMEAATGASVPDYTGNGHALTNYNNVASATGKIGNGMAGDGHVGYLSTALDLSSFPAFTIAFWFKTSVGDTGDAEIFFGWDTGTDTIQICVNTDGGRGVPAGGFEIRLSSVSGGSSLNAVSDGNWHYAVITCASHILSLYIDNVYQNQSDTGYVLSGTGGTLNFGAYLGYHCPITFDEAGLWNRALNTTEIGHLWNSGAGLTAP